MKGKTLYKRLKRISIYIYHRDLNFRRRLVSHRLPNVYPFHPSTRNPKPPHLQITGAEQSEQRTRFRRKNVFHPFSNREKSDGTPTRPESPIYKVRVRAATPKSTFLEAVKVSQTYVQIQSVFQKMSLPFLAAGISKIWKRPGAKNKTNKQTNNRDAITPSRIHDE